MSVLQNALAFAARSLLEKLDDPLYSSMLVKGPPSPKGKASPKGFNGVEAASSFFTGSTPGGTPRGAEPPVVEEDGVKEKHDGILRQLTVTSTALGPDGKLLPAPVKAVKKAPPATTIDPHTGAATIDFKEVLGEDEVVANKTTDEQVMSVDITDLSALKSLSTVLGVTGFDTVNGAQLQSKRWLSVAPIYSHVG